MIGAAVKLWGKNRNQNRVSLVETLALNIRVLRSNMHGNAN